MPSVIGATIGNMIVGGISSIRSNRMADGSDSIGDIIEKSGGAWDEGSESARGGLKYFVNPDYAEGGSLGDDREGGGPEMVPSFNTAPNGDTTQTFPDDAVVIEGRNLPWWEVTYNKVVDFFQHLPASVNYSQQFVTDYRSSVDRAVATMGAGWDQLNSYDYSGGDGVSANLNTASGLLTIGGGAIAYVGAPISGPMNTVFGRPLEAFTDGAIPREFAGDATVTVGSLFVGGAGVRGTGVRGAGTVIVESEIPQITLNKMAGDAFEADVLANVLPKTQANIQPQITIKSNGPSGLKVRLDALGDDTATGTTRMSDMKASSTAPLTSNQTVVYPELELYGGVVVGNGKAPYVGGTYIPPTAVDIIRKAKQ